MTLCLSFTAMSRAVVPQCGLKSAVPPSPGNLLEMQGLRAQLRPAESETLGAETSPLCSPPGDSDASINLRTTGLEVGEAGIDYLNSLPHFLNMNLLELLPPTS